MSRRDDWPGGLAEVVSRYRGRPFQWGETDCATFFSDAVAAMTGHDPFASFRPWSSEFCAATRLVRAGVRSVEDFVAARFDSIPPVAAGRGDVGYLEERHALTCPVIILGAEAVSMTESGLAIVPRTLIVRAFRVG